MKHCHLALAMTITIVVLLGVVGRLCFCDAGQGQDPNKHGGHGQDHDDDHNHGHEGEYCSSGQLTLFPFGAENGDEVLPAGDDGVYSLVTLLSPFILKGTVYNGVYVNINGLLSFSTPVGTNNVGVCGAATTTPQINVYWSDVDTRNTPAGQIFYGQTTNQTVLDRIACDARQALKLAITPTSAFVATWNQVTYFGTCVRPIEDSPQNTYQVVLASDGLISVVLFLYQKLTWLEPYYYFYPNPAVPPPCETGVGDEALPAEAGFDQGDGRPTHYILPGSCTVGILNLTTTSNMGIDGQWIFQVDTPFRN